MVTEIVSAVETFSLRFRRGNCFHYSHQMNAPGKKVIEVFPQVHSRLTNRAKQAGISSKQYASYLLDYAMDKEEAGDLTIVCKATEVSGVETSESQGASAHAH
jgi:hypothetical protein